MVGLDIQIPNEVGKYIWNLLEDIDFFQYLWTIQYADVILYENGQWNLEKVLFDAAEMKGKEFFRCISCSDYYLIFADIHAYPLKGKVKTIETYQDFLDSDCDLIFLCVDSEFVEVYCKNKKILQQIIKNCEKYQFKTAEISLESAYNRRLMW